MAKRTFASRTWKARTFASRTWRPAVTVVPGGGGFGVGARLLAYEHWLRDRRDIHIPPRRRLPEIPVIIRPEPEPILEPIEVLFFEDLKKKKIPKRIKKLWHKRLILLKKQVLEEDNLVLADFDPELARMLSERF
jgi:hypothetical protein